MLFTYTFTAPKIEIDRPDTFDLDDYDEEATGLVENELAASLTEAALKRKPAYVYGKFIDLDGKGSPEIVARLNSRYLCGDASSSCAYVIARKDRDLPADLQRHRRRADGNPRFQFRGLA